MNIMVIGSGGREHSLVQSLAESTKVKTIYAVPGNAGMEELAERVSIKETAHDQLVAFAKENNVDLTIVGPEVPLLAGVVDHFQEAGLKAFGPTKEAALIEGSKHYAKQLMHKYNIPTADYQAFTNADEAKRYIQDKGAPIVVKADGLAAGKGVVVAETVAEAVGAVEEMLENGQFGEASEEVVIEEFLQGEEFSYMAFVNGSAVYPMMPAKDHKRAHDGDLGPNTGGMGAIAPVPNLPKETYDTALTSILQRTADSLVEEGRPFTGILYAGLIQTLEGPKVIEFNARFGDPETQVVLPLLENDLVQVFLDVLDGNDPQLSWSEDSCAGVVVASSGYPGKYEKKRPIPNLNDLSTTFTVHAGTEKNDEGFISNGGRVLLVGSKQKTLTEALSAIYNDLKEFEGNDDFFYRNDIGHTHVSSS